jgi:hypothetical protein
MKAKPILLKGLLAAVVACALTAAPGAVMARAPEISTPAFSKLALGGYDAVAYFDGGRPLKGDPRFTAEWKGAQFRFASAQHLARFRANPAAYAPQYGGYCAWAVSNNYTAKGDPLAWRIVGGKLYLNFNATVQNRWEKDIPGHIARADRNWPRVLN